jgi:BMFP domain-containing protein YqiC
MGMKIRFLKTVAVDVETRFADIESRGFNRWDVVKVNEFLDLGERASLVLENNDTLIEVPKSSFEVLDK